MPESPALRAAGSGQAARAAGGAAAGRVKTYCLRGAVSGRDALCARPALLVVKPVRICFRFADLVEAG